MFEEKSAPSLAGRVRVMQFVVFSLTTGVLIFAGVVLWGPQKVQPQPGSLLTLMAVCMGAMSMAMALVLPRFMSEVQRRKIVAGTWQPAQKMDPLPASDAEKLVMVYQIKTVLGAALLEGAAFFGLVAYMLERQPAAVGVVGAMLVGLLAFFPTVGRVEGWVDVQLRKMADERALG